MTSGKGERLIDKNALHATPIPLLQLISISRNDCKALTKRHKSVADKG
jgi:hypothetical protein